MEKVQARGVASLHVHGKAKSSIQQSLVSSPLNLMRKASAAGTRADKETEQLAASATAQTDFLVDMDRDKDKKGLSHRRAASTNQLL